MESHEPWRSDSYDAERHSLNKESLAEHSGTASEAPCPEVVAQDGDLSMLFFVGRIEDSTSASPHSQSRKEITADHVGLKLFRSEEHTSELQSRRDLVCR